jgi:hypothetical protein
MGRLVIAHHKSYHPYRAENIERVKRDEEEARLQEAKEEGRLKLAVRGLHRWPFSTNTLVKS